MFVFNPRMYQTKKVTSKTKIGHMFYIPHACGIYSVDACEMRQKVEYILEAAIQMYPGNFTA